MSAMGTKGFTQVVLLQAGALLVACATPKAHWSAIRPAHCTGNGYRLSTAILDAPADASGQDACMKSPATIDGVAFSAPKRCRNMCGKMRGEFDVPDATCEVKTSKIPGRLRRARDRIKGCAKLVEQAAKSLDDFSKRFKAGAQLRELSDPTLQNAADECGFRSITVSVVGDASYVIGANVAPGIAFGVNDCSEPRGIATVGFTVGPSVGVDGELQLGFWEATVDGLAGWLWGVTLGGHYYAGFGLTAFYDLNKPPGFQGLVLGLGPGMGVEGEVGMAATEYTDAVVAFAKDAGAVITGQETSHGAQLGGACTVGADCQGYRLPLGNKSGVACCKRRCVKTKRDWAGIWWCPHVCKKGPLARNGSCR